MTVSVYGPSEAGKTIMIRRLCQEFADRTDDVDVEYANLKERRTIFSATSGSCSPLTARNVERTWVSMVSSRQSGTVLRHNLEWTVLILGKMDHIRHDLNHDSSDFIHHCFETKASSHEN